MKLDDSVDVEEVTTDVPDNYLLCICENRENLKDRKKGDIVIGIMVSNFHDRISILGFLWSFFEHCFVGAFWELGGYLLKFMIVLFFRFCGVWCIFFFLVIMCSLWMMPSVCEL